MEEARLLIEFAGVLAVMAIAAFLLPSIKYHKDDNHYLFIKICLGVALILLISFTIDDVLSIDEIQHNYSPLRHAMATMAYALRPLLFYLLVLTIKRRKLKYELLIAIPIMINIVLLIVSLFTGLVFSFGQANNFVAGPLRYYPIIITGLYLVYLLVNVILLFKDRHIVEVVPLFFIVFSGVICTILLYLDITTVALDFLMVAGTVFYSMLLNVYYSKRDSLTGLFNHQAYYSDAQLRKKHIQAVFSIDMNGLKVINDTKGHQEGDEALIAIADAIDRASHNKISARIYRIGGDEFAILCFSGSEEQIAKYSESIKENIKNTPYSASVGYYYKHEDDESFHDMYNFADKDMYKDKKQYYKDKEEEK